MKNIFILVLAAAFGVSLAYGQAADQKVRSISHQDALKTNNTYQQVNFQSLRIEEGKLWINGNLISQANLPEGLQNIPPAYKLQLSFQGDSEMEVSLFGKEYLIRNGQIALLPRPAAPPIPDPVLSNDEKSDYYSNVKNQAPVMFQRMNREALLYESCMRLVIDYQIADEKQRQTIREDMRLNLGEQFDLSLENMELEVEMLEQQIEAIKADIEYRRKNRSGIIEQRLNELTGGR